MITNRKLGQEKLSYKTARNFPYPRTFIVFLTLACFTLSGCPSYNVARIPSLEPSDLSSVQSKGGLSAGIDVFSPERTKAYFDANLQAKGIQPVYLTVHNDTDKRWSVDVSELGPLSSEEVAKKTSNSVLGRAGGWGIVGVLIFWPLLIPAAADSIAAHNANKERRSDFISKELAQASVNPKHTVNGVLFLRTIKRGDQLPVTLKNVETNERIRFVFVNGEN